MPLPPNIPTPNLPPTLPSPTPPAPTSGAASGSVQPPGLSLLLGNFSFLNFECPEEIDHFGGHQNMAVHKFAGGQKTVQTFGGFPPDVIRWSGQFWTGDAPGQLVNGRIQVPDMFQDRIAPLNQARYDGQPMLLTIGPYEYFVLIHDFRVYYRLQWWQPYFIELVPLTDLTQGGSTGNPANNPISDFNEMAAQAGKLTPPVEDVPPLGAPTSPPAGQSGTPGKLAPPTLPENLTKFQKQLIMSLQQSPTAVPIGAKNPALQGALNDARNDINPMIASTNSAESTFAFNAGNVLDVIDNQINPTPGLITVQRVINPNLFGLAVEHYQDASKWTEIARANGILDPQPVGIFNLNIPRLA